MTAEEREKLEVLIFKLLKQWLAIASHFSEGNIARFKIRPSEFEMWEMGGKNEEFTWV